MQKVRYEHVKYQNWTSFDTVSKLYEYSLEKKCFTYKEAVNVVGLPVPSFLFYFHKHIKK